MKHFLLTSITLLNTIILSASCVGQVTPQQDKSETQSSGNATPIPLQSPASVGGGIDIADESVISVFDAYRTAVTSKDYKAMYSTISPAYQDGMIFEGMFALGSGASSDEADAVLEGAFDEKRFADLKSAIVKERALTERDSVDLITQSVIDRQKFFTDSWTYLKSRSPDQQPPKYSELSGLKIEDNVASAKAECTSTTHGLTQISDGIQKTRTYTQTASVDIYFIKSNGSWVVASKAEWSKLKEAGDHEPTIAR